MEQRIGQLEGGRKENLLDEWRPLREQRNEAGVEEVMGRGGANEGRQVQVRSGQVNQAEMLHIERTTDMQ